MPTVAELFRDIGDEIGDPSNARVPQWKLITWIDKAVKKAVRDTNCLWTRETLTGQRKITIVAFASLTADTITLVVSGVTTTITIAAAASNTAMATAITAQLNAVTGVKAYSSGAIIYVVGIGGYTISIMTGLFMKSLLIRWTSAGMVAEKRRVTRFLGRVRMIRTT